MNILRSLVICYFISISALILWECSEETRHNLIKTYNIIYEENIKRCNEYKWSECKMWKFTKLFSFSNKALFLYFCENNSTEVCSTFVIFYISSMPVWLTITGVIYTAIISYIFLRWLFLLLIYMFINLPLSMILCSIPIFINHPYFILLTGLLGIYIICSFKKFI